MIQLLMILALMRLLVATCFDFGPWKYTLEDRLIDELPEVDTAEITCRSWPIQIEGLMQIHGITYCYYFRYRSGLLSLGLGNTPRAAVFNGFSNQFRLVEHEDSSYNPRYSEFDDDDDLIIAFRFILDQWLDQELVSHE